jgi:hypothetical protein
MESILCRARALAAWAMASTVLLGGCGMHGIRVDDVPRPTVRSNWAQAGIQDQRQAFADLFCQIYGEGGATSDCRHWLWSSTNVPATTASRPSPLTPRQRTLVIVPGIFGECVAPWATPFSSDHKALEGMGYRVTVLQLKGRGSSAVNADIIHKQLSDPALALKDAVVIAYSKGLTDFMLAASQPEAEAWRGNVSALVSVAGTANGSPAANHGASLYEDLLAKLPVEYCDPSDGGGVRSLTYNEAMRVSDAFVASKPPFATYSVIAVGAQGSINPVLKGFHRLLSRIDERNDGQVLMEDAVIPGSTVLGVFRADHWSIALPFEDSDAWQVKPLSVNNAFPRGVLIRAVLDFVAPVEASPISIKEH